MVSSEEEACPKCGGSLKYYDRIYRMIRTKGGHAKRTKIRRLRCVGCGALHNELPSDIFPHKQYEAEIIVGVIEGLITADTLGYEDYPCEMTMKRWKRAWQANGAKKAVLRALFFCFFVPHELFFQMANPNLE